MIIKITILITIFLTTQLISETFNEELPPPPPPPPILLSGEWDQPPFRYIKETKPLIISEERIVEEYLHYPKMVHIAKVNGVVDLTFRVSKEGIPTNIRVVREKPVKLGFGDAAIDAFKKVRFIPATQMGKPVVVKGKYRVHFKVEE